MDPEVFPAGVEESTIALRRRPRERHGLCCTHFPEAAVCGGTDHPARAFED
ncbi:MULTISPECIES: hypothetical protein [Rhodococcus]|uniref:hypothetical protein n=1 Tax=Rhodococcus TaxID=1827 RepID=UPI0017EAF1C1|nr:MULTISPECIES: hypothetical protein [Rhodococcus]MBA8964619.1 hypothetical protein [Rhodococcus opacus]MBP2207419.1 hypothetical protein [Rhodococcus opacus]MDI9941608.1 hypothetical protein [Rhodococcus sp. IEGM 1351]MDJ0417974.1 hypothetical protein [Rhodococcus opacus]WKN53222.1 hypothetical protein HJ581_0005015 [Rhodococcus opacus]